MMRQSSSRNHRSRRWKVKHVLQMCLSVVVCLWLLYQVKHSHDKEKALEEGALQVSDRVEEGRPDFLKLGRKDPHGETVVTATDNIVHNKEEENEEAEEAAEQENKQEENEEEEGRGPGDDEVDESDQERGDDEAEGGEEFGDEKEDGQSEDVSLLENRDHDDDEVKSQGAREEHYKADDASSAVVRDSQGLVQENENLEAGNLDVQQENTEKGELENDAKTNTEEKGELENDAKTNGSEVTSTNDEMRNVPTNSERQSNNNVSLNDPTVGERELEVESPSDQTMVLEPPAHVEGHSITASNSSGGLEQNNNNPNQYEQRSDSAGAVPGGQMQAQNVSTGNSESRDSTPGTEAVNMDSATDESRVNETSNLTEGNSVSENTTAEQTEKSNTSKGADKAANPSPVTNGDGDSLLGNATNSQTESSTIPGGDRQARIGLPTLRDIQGETKEEEEVPAE